MAILSENEAAVIVERLLDRTKAGTLNWSVFEPSRGKEYVARTKNFTYYVKSRDEDEMAPYVLQLWKNGRPGSESAKVDEIETGVDGPYNEALSSLYSAAQLLALGIESLKDDILKDLE